MGESPKSVTARAMRRAHRDLVAWQEAMVLVEEVYKETTRFPPSEPSGLVGQMRRCVISVPSNIAEGAARRSRGELAYFVGVAQGSLSELDTQVEIARRLGYLRNDSMLQSRLDLVFALLLGLARSLKVAKA
jgi:four helix bundle protein